MSGNEQFERDFESFLSEEDSRLAALYRKLPRPEPDAKLDAAVLAMARRAAAANPRAHARATRWIPALSAAAVVALAAGIGFRIGPSVWQERDRGALQKSIDEYAAPPATSAAPAAPAAPMKTAPSADADAFKDKGAESPVPKPATPPEPQPRTTAAPAPAAGYAAPTKPQMRESFRKTEDAARRADTPAPQAFPQIEAPEQEKKSAQPGAAATAADAGNAQVAGAIAPQDTLDEKRDQRPSAAAEAPALKMREESAPKPVAAPAPPPVQTSAPAPVPAPPPVMETPATGGAAAESMLAPAPAAAKAARMTPRSKDPNANLYPEHWLQNIRTMLQERKRDEAARSLAEFRKMYPDYHLPDDLRDLK